MTKEKMERLYIDLNLTIDEVKAITGMEEGTIRHFLQQHGIKKEQTAKTEAKKRRRKEYARGIIVVKYTKAMFCKQMRRELNGEKKRKESERRTEKAS